MSRLLDEARREQWARAGEPERPPLPPPEQLIDYGRFSTDAGERFSGGPDLKQRTREQDAEYRAAAKAQVEWEAEARRDYERRRDSDALQHPPLGRAAITTAGATAPPSRNQEPRRAGQPAAKPTGLSRRRPQVTSRIQFRDGLRRSRNCSAAGTAPTTPEARRDFERRRDSDAG